MVFTLGSFVLVTVAVAFVSWLKTKGTDETSKDGYFLGGRSLSGLVIFGSLMMTNLSAEQLVGRNGQGYAAGMTAMGWETMFRSFWKAALTAQPASLYRSFSLSLIL